MAGNSATLARSILKITRRSGDAACVIKIRSKRPMIWPCYSRAGPVDARHPRTTASDWAPIVLNNFVGHELLTYCPEVAPRRHRVTIPARRGSCDYSVSAALGPRRRVERAEMDCASEPRRCALLNRSPRFRRWRSRMHRASFGSADALSDQPPCCRVRIAGRSWLCVEDHGLPRPDRLLLSATSPSIRACNPKRKRPQIAATGPSLAVSNFHG